MKRQRKPKGRLCTLYIRKLPRDVKDSFKAWCTRRGLTMTEVMVRLMSNCVGENEFREYIQYPSQIKTK